MEVVDLFYAGDFGFVEGVCGGFPLVKGPGCREWKMMGIDRAVGRGEGGLEIDKLGEHDARAGNGLPLVV